MRASLLERVTRLEDQLRNGLKYDKKRNVWILVWTERQIRKIKRQARELRKRIKEPRTAT